jgi:hypothetical protein
VAETDRCGARDEQRAPAVGPARVAAVVHRGGRRPVGGRAAAGSDVDTYFLARFLVTKSQFTMFQNASMYFGRAFR